MSSKSVDFQENEEVLSFHGPLLYTAKVKWRNSIVLLLTDLGRLSKSTNPARSRSLFITKDGTESKVLILACVFLHCVNRFLSGQLG